MCYQVDVVVLVDWIVIDLVGIGDWYVGELFDMCVQVVVWSCGYDLLVLCVWQVSVVDFEWFDLLFVMDEVNFVELCCCCLLQYCDKVCLLMEFVLGVIEIEVVDLYFGGVQGFEQVFDQVECVCVGLLEMFWVCMVC